jgi:hypothetical protein
MAIYNADGSLDNTFSEDGKQKTDLGSFDDWAYSVATQSDGKILVGGSVFISGEGSFLAMSVIIL